MSIYHILLLNKLGIILKKDWNMHNKHRQTSLRVFQESSATHAFKDNSAACQTHSSCMVLLPLENVYVAIWYKQGVLFAEFNTFTSVNYLNMHYLPIYLHQKYEITI